MKNIKLGAILSLICLFFILLPIAGASTITVTPSTTEGAQISINQAINSVVGTSTNPVYVKLTSGTYKITGSIILKSNVILQGAGDSTIIYATGTVCNTENTPAYVYGNGVSHVEVSSMQFKSSARGTSDGGHGDYRNCIQFRSCSYASVHDVLFTNYLYCDGVRVSKSKYVTIYNNRIRAGHDGICFYQVTNSRAYNNDFQIRTNTGTRVDGSSNIELDHNTYYGLYGSGWCVVEIENSVKGVNIHNNIMHDYRGSSGSYAVAPVKGASGDVLVRGNVLWNIGSIAYGTSKDNIINPADKSVSSWVAKGYGAGSSSSDITPMEPPIEPPVTPPVATDVFVLPVTFSGSGAFVCASVGKTASNDQIVINKALVYAKSNNISEVRLNGPHSYYVNSVIIKPDGVKLSGVKGAQIIWNF